METYTKASTSSYTHTRINVLDDHFELFLRSSDMNNADVEKLLSAVDRHELEAVGIYLQEGSFRILEVEFSVDWNKHMEFVRLSGHLFNTDIGGWKEGIAPEAYISVQKLVKLAKERNLRVRSWIRVSEHIRRSPLEHQRVCNALGYGGSVPPWKYPPNIQNRQISGLEEGQITTRVGQI